MVITLTGNNHFLLSQRLAGLTGQFLAEHGELTLERLDAAELSLSDLLPAIASLPFLASKKMIVLRQPSANREMADQIEQIISSVDAATTLVIFEPLPDKRTIFYKTLKKLTEFEEFDELPPAALAKWLLKAAEQQGAALDLADANYLIDRLGTDQATLSQELEKLALYEPAISRANIDKLTDKTPQSKVFELLEAAFSGTRDQALSLYDEQRAARIEPQNILALISWQLNLIALAMAGKGRPAALIAKQAGVAPYPLTKAQRLAARLSEQKLKDIINQVVSIDYRSKQTPLDLDEALKTFITTL